MPPCKEGIESHHLQSPAKIRQIWVGRKAQGRHAGSVVLSTIDPFRSPLYHFQKKKKKKEENADTQTPFLAPCKVPEQYSNPQCPLQQVSGVFRIPTIQGWQGLPLPVRPTIQGWQVFPESESSQVDVEREATRRTEEAEIRRPLSPLRHGQLRLLVHGRVQKELVPFTQRPPRSGLPLERSLSAVPRPCY